MADFLRELAVGIGFQIDTTNLMSADRMTDEFKANAIAAEGDMDKLGVAVTDLGSQATLGMGMAANAATGFQTEATGAKIQLDELGKTLKENRALIAGAFAASAGAIGLSVKTAADFEAAMSRVGAVSRASDEDMRLLSDTARELGATTVFSASQAAEGMQYLAMAGFQTNEIIQAMPGLLDTAAAAQLDLGSASNIVSNILKGFDISAEHAGQVADVLTATFTTSNTSLQSLGESMKMVAPVAAGLGISVEETAAMVGKLGDMGIQGSMAGTALRTVLTSLASPSSEAAKQMSALGVQVTDNSGNMLPMVNIIDQLTRATAGMGEAQRTAFLETLAGRQGITSLTALMAVGADQIEDYTANLRDSAGVAGDVARRQMDNLQGTMKELGSAVEGAQIAIGTAFIPVMRLGARIVTALVTAFNKLPGPLQTTVAVGLGAVAMLSGVALAAGFIIPKLGMLKSGFLLLKAPFTMITALGAKMGITLTASLWPVALGVAAVVAGVLIAQDVLMAFRGTGDTLTARVFEWGAGVLGFAITWEEAVTNIKDWFFGMVDAFKANPIGFLIDWSPFGLLKRGVEALLGGFRDWLADKGIKLPEFKVPSFPDLIEMASDTFDTFLTWLSEFDLGSAIGTAIGSAWDFVTKPLENFTQGIRDWLPFSPAKEGPLSDLDQVGTNFVDTIAGGIQAAGTGALDDALIGALQVSPMADGLMSSSGAVSAPRGMGGGISLDLVVNVDARGASEETAETIGETTASKIRDVLDQWVTEAFYSVALEEV
ncbi:MAG: phage tail tape measure protein [Firmicutes bacterium]|nr:phage tail tape measure protein [Bacillota bacterium]